MMDNENSIFNFDDKFGVESPFKNWLLNSESKKYEGDFFDWGGKYLGQIGKSGKIYRTESSDFNQLKKGEKGFARLLGTKLDFVSLAVAAHGETKKIEKETETYNERRAIMYAILNFNKGWNKVKTRAGKANETEHVYQSAIRIANAVSDGNERTKIIKNTPFFANVDFAKWNGLTDIKLSAKAAIHVLGNYPAGDISLGAHSWDGKDDFINQYENRENDTRTYKGVVRTNNKFHAGYKMNNSLGKVSSFPKNGHFYYASTIIIGNSIFAKINAYV